MKRFIQKLARWAGVSSSVPTFAAPVAPEWTFSDAQQWQTFLKSPAGIALWQRARARQASLCIEACDGKCDPKTAGGFTFTLNWLESLANPEAISTAEVAKSANDEAELGETQDLETSIA